MRSELLEILACPQDKSRLVATIEGRSGDDIVTGILTCPECKATYPIVNSIPNLLIK